MEAIDGGAAGPGNLDSAADRAGPATQASDRERDAVVQRGTRPWFTRAADGWTCGQTTRTRFTACPSTPR